MIFPEYQGGKCTIGKTEINSIKKYEKEKISALIAVFALLTAGPLTGCGKKESTTPGTTQKTEQPVHNHTFSTAWDKDETKHWNTCTDSSCNEKINLASHTFVWTEKTKADIHKDKVEKVFALSANTRQKEQLRVLVSMNGERNGRVISPVIGMRQLVQAMIR